MTEKQRRIAEELERLVHNRFNEESLNRRLSEIFIANVKVKEICRDIYHFPDYVVAWDCDYPDICGCFDFYFLKHKPNYEGDTTMYITEVTYEFY
jgi:hypothetical protein